MITIIHIALFMVGYLAAIFILLRWQRHADEREHEERKRFIESLHNNE